MPTMIDGKKNKKQVNGSQLVNEINQRISNISNSKISVVVEHVTAMPGQGVTSMLTLDNHLVC